MKRDEAVWYYRLGGKTLGPVAWTEIEALTRDTVDADQLLVARGGDAQWMKASEALAADPELAAAPAEEAAAEEPAAAPPEKWSLIDEEEPEPASAGWEPAQPQPSSAASEVIGTAAVARDTGRPAAQAPLRPASRPTGMPVKSDLGGWIGQAWEMVTGDAAAFILGTLLAGLVTVFTLGIGGPPMQAGLFLMALKRFQKEPISAGTVFEGFHYFLPAWGVLLVQGLLGAVAGGLIGGAIGGGLGAAGADEQVIGLVGQGIGSIISLVIAAAFFYAMVLVVSAGVGTI